jgi:2-polyprenyl-3-methyl-5-hydroxy-6-metoxy-1,4-benzoquinol methylase
MDAAKSKELLGRVVSDVGGAFTVGMAYVGDRLGLFKTLARRGPCSSQDLAVDTGLHERYVREWLKGMVAAEYVEHDETTDAYSMTLEQAAVLAYEDSPVFAAGAFQFTIPSLLHTSAILDAFCHGGGIRFSALGEDIAEAIDRMHRPWFQHLLVPVWIPGVPGLEARLRDGIVVLDVGCGLGRSTVAVGEAFPQSTVVGVDPHGQSIEQARALAKERRTENVRFVESTLDELPQRASYDLIMAIDCIHDMSEPVTALRVMKKLLAEDGVVFWSEPTGSHNPVENRNPYGKMRANLSTFHCLTVSLAEGGAGLGTIIGERGARRLAQEAGFPRFTKLPIENAMQQFFGLSR